MKKSNMFLVLMFCVIAVSSYAGEIVPSLDDSSAQKDYTSAYAGGQYEIDPDLNGVITLAARFNPDASQSSGGPYIILEIGGTSNGTGLYLCDGHVVFVSSTGSGPAVPPESMQDTDWSVISNERTLAVQLGSVSFGSENVVYASLDLVAGTLLCSVNKVVTTYTITNTANTNLDGNESICFLTRGSIVAGWMGGLHELSGSSFPLLYAANAASMIQTSGYSNQRAQIFSEAVSELILSMPYDPTPADGAAEVAVEEVTLSWQAGTDPNGDPLPTLEGYYVYFGEESDALYQMNTTLLPAETTTYNVGTLSTDTTYYWKVEEVLENGLGGTYAAGDPNNIMGSVWSFTTIVSIPVITGQPDDVLADVSGTAQFSITAASLSTVHYAWYKSTDASNSTSSDDVSVGTDSATLTLSNISTSDEGYYYCSVSNDSGTPVASDTAQLEVKKIVAWYPFENDLTDSVGDNDGTAIKADPNVPLTYAAGKVNQAIVLNGTDEAVEIPRTIQNSMTIELWVKTTASNSGTGGWWNGLGLVDGEVADYVNDFGTVLLGNKFSFGVGNKSDASYVTISSTTPINDGQWHYCVATRDHTTGQIIVYVDGAQEASAAASLGTKDSPEVLRIGARQTGGNFLAGQIDEVKLYNYPLAELTVASQYHAVTGKTVCVLSQKPDTKYDTNGDCIVNLEDFAALASGWLNCGLYPQTDCQ